MTTPRYAKALEAAKPIPKRSTGVYEPRGPLCEYCEPHMGRPQANPATIYCPGCGRNLCDSCLDAH